MKRFKTVFVFEFLGYLKNKAFIATTIIMSVVFLGLPTVPTVIGYINSSGDKKEDARACVAGAPDGYTADFFNGYLPDYRFDVLPDTDAAFAGINDGTYDMALVVDGLNFTVYLKTIKLTSFAVLASADTAVTELNRREYLRGRGLTAGDIAAASDIRAAGEITAVSGEADEGAFMRNTVYAYVLIFLLYLTLIMYGSYIVSSVVGEKSSKAMELLIVSVKPVYLMFGKVFGVAAAGLCQFLIYILCGALSLGVNGMFWLSMFAEETDLSAVSGDMAAMLATPVSPYIFIFLIIFFILGFLFYAFIYAGLASTCSRMEEANAVVSLPMIFIVAAFMISIFGLMDSGGALIKVLSYIPFFTPMLMFMRVCMGSAGLLEAFVSIVVLAASVYFSGVLSAKIYRVGVLMYGKPPKPKEIIKMLIRPVSG